MPTYIVRVLASVLGVSGIGLGAFGAHALKPQLTSSGHLETWQTAVLYHLLHAVAFVALAAISSDTAPRILIKWTAVSWATGVLLFSGSLYALALGGPRWLGPITPLGGTALIVGWFLLGLSALKKPSRSGPH